MSRTDVYEGTLLDDYELSERARAYAEWVVRGPDWALSDVDLSAVAWETSTRARKRHGRCLYEPDGRCVVTISERTYERAGFAGCEPTVRHELVHVWQHQHADEWATMADDCVQLTDDGTPDGAVRIERGHGPSFRLWIDPLDLDGRSSTPYERTKNDFNYVYECPSCGNWWGKHRLCKSVRQAAYGQTGDLGYRFCTACDVLVHLRVGDAFLVHDRYDDEAIRSFASGEFDSVSTAPVDRLTPTPRSGSTR